MDRNSLVSDHEAAWGFPSSRDLLPRKTWKKGRESNPVGHSFRRSCFFCDALRAKRGVYLISESVMSSGIFALVRCVRWHLWTCRAVCSLQHEVSVCSQDATQKAASLHQNWSRCPSGSGTIIGLRRVWTGQIWQLGPFVDRKQHFVHQRQHLFPYENHNLTKNDTSPLQGGVGAVVLVSSMLGLATATVNVHLRVGDTFCIMRFQLLSRHQPSAGGCWRCRSCFIDARIGYCYGQCPSPNW
jgi:hypothetical protein